MITTVVVIVVVIRASPRPHGTLSERQRRRCGYGIAAVAVAVAAPQPDPTGSKGWTFHAQYARHVVFFIVEARSLYILYETSGVCLHTSLTVVNSRIN